MKLPHAVIGSHLDSTKNFERLRLYLPTEPVTVLPSSPVDGQVIDYLADATNGVIWRLRYRRTSASVYKWEFVGGSALVAYKEGKLEQTLASKTFVYQEAANAPTLTVPLAGEYRPTLQVGDLQQEQELEGPQINVGFGTEAGSVSLVGVFLGPKKEGKFMVTSLSGAGLGGSQVGYAKGNVIKVWIAGNSEVAKLWGLLYIQLGLTPVRVG